MILGRNKCRYEGENVPEFDSNKLFNEKFLTYPYPKSLSSFLAEVVVLLARWHSVTARVDL